MKQELNIGEYSRDTFQQWFWSQKDGAAATIHYKDDKGRDRDILTTVTRDEKTGRMVLNFFGVKYKYQNQWITYQFYNQFCGGKNYIIYKIHS